MKASTGKTIVAWVLQVLLGGFIAMAGAAKLFADPATVEMFEQIGAEQWLRLVVGGLEVLGGIGLVVPRVRVLAALGITLLMLAATVVNAAILDSSPVVTVVLAAVALSIAMLRRQELTSTFSRNSGRALST